MCIRDSIRSSTLIGMLTATGIGYLFDMYYKRLYFSSASLVVLDVYKRQLFFSSISFSST